MTSRELFLAHVDLCKQCQENPYGLCPRGFALLGRASRMRDDNAQVEFDFERRKDEKPFSRMAFESAVQSERRKLREVTPLSTPHAHRQTSEVARNIL
jgi:hypothetical protein